MIAANASASSGASPRHLSGTSGDSPREMMHFASYGFDFDEKINCCSPRQTRDNGEGLRAVRAQMGVLFVKKTKKWRGALERVDLEVG